MKRTVRICVAVLLMLAMNSGCAHKPRGVPIEARPTPPPPPNPRDPHTPSAEARPIHPTQPIRTRILADTTAARAAYERCRRRTLLPDQEPIMETTKELLMKARVELLMGRLGPAESAARQARQLARSLRCP